MSPAADAGETPAMLTALFNRAADTERAYRATMALGYTSDEINLVLSEETRRHHFTLSEVSAGLARKAKQSTEQKPADASADATELGGPAGATVGTIAPAAAAVGTALLLPGLILAGPVAVALAAAGAVGVAGGLAGALTNWGIPKGRVEAYEKEIRDGGILIGVKPKSAEDATELAIQWESAGGAMVRDAG